jgi:5'/3'-nucleotidase
MTERVIVPRRILVCNDDGIAAPGIAVLETIAAEFAREVWVVAPEQEQSGASHSLTTRRPLRLRELGERRYAVDGTPTDCVLLAVKRLLRDHPPDLVLSGVNAGLNAGEDLNYSGTVAAAMEAVLLGIPAVALSQDYGDSGPIPWATAAHWGPLVLRRLLRLPWPEDTMINVNFPALAADRVAGIAATRQGRRVMADNMTEGLDPRGRPYFWIGPAGAEWIGDANSDFAALNARLVSATPIYLNLTNERALAALREMFA